MGYGVAPPRAAPATAVRAVGRCRRAKVALYPKRAGRPSPSQLRTEGEAAAVSRSLRRGTLAAFLVLAIAPLSACAVGNDAASLQVKPDSAATTVGDIEIQNAVVIVGSGSNDAVGVSAALVNNGTKPQTLRSVQIGGVAAPLALSTANSNNGTGGTIIVPPGNSVLLGGPGNPAATVQGDAASLRGSVGNNQRVTFTFSRTGAVPITALTVAAENYYESFGPTPKPSPSRAASPSAPANGSPSAGASGSADQPAPGAGTQSTPPAGQASPAVDAATPPAANASPATNG